MLLDHMIITCTLLKEHVPSFGVFNCDIADIAPVVWLTCEHGTEMGTPSPVLNKHRKLSPVSEEGRPELIVRVTQECTPSTQRVHISCTAQTTSETGTLLNENLDHL
ncbi:hypothetical protein EMCRGX_G027042 [Ephydatia muelleri]